MKIVAYLYYWMLDYIYVSNVQLRALLSRGRPEQYKAPGAQAIILIPGVYENWRFMEPLASLLHQNGYDVHVVDGLGYNRGEVKAMAEMVTSYITAHRLTDVILVSHSKGGLVGKYALSSSPIETIRGLVALNAPFAGSRYAYLLPFKSLRVFTPHSPVLTKLKSFQSVNKRIVSIYGTFDPHIPGGSSLDGATNIQLATYGHFRIIKDKQVQDTILTAIKTLRGND